MLENMTQERWDKMTPAKTTKTANGALTLNLNTWKASLSSAPIAALRSNRLTVRSRSSQHHVPASPAPARGIGC